MNNISDKMKKQIIETHPPSPADEKWLDYIDELPFKSDEYLTMFADKLLGLNTALISGYIASIKITGIMHSGIVLIPVILFVLSVSCCLYSLYPKIIRGNFNVLTIIKRNYMRGIYYRNKAVTISAISFFLGLLSGIVILLIH